MTKILREESPGQTIISIVIIGRNEGRRLTDCLQSVSLMEGVEGEVEVIYVDSGSSDGSAQAAGALDAQVIVLHGGIQTAARARNAGWQRASAPWILFLDGDTILQPQFVRIGMNVLQRDPRIAAVWGHRRERYPERSIYNRILDLDWIYPAGDTDFCGGDVLMRKTALAEVGGYDPSLIAGEEPELCCRMRARGYRIVHVDEPMTLHDLDMKRFQQYWSRAVRAGYAYAEVSNRYRESADPMWSRESRENIRRGGFWLVWSAVSLLLLAFRSFWVLPWLVVLPALSIRSAWKARSRAEGKKTLLVLYGLHSQVQQIPILFGQLRYFRNRHLDKKGSQIEHNEGASA